MRPILAILAALALVGPAQADSVTDQLQQARQYYEQGDITGAIGELEFAIQELRSKLGAAYLTTFPPPPSGWTVEAAKAEESGPAVPFLGGGSILRREYRDASGSTTIEAQLMTGGSFLQGLASMLTNPQVLAAQPNARRVRVGRDNAVVTYDPAQRSGQLVLDVGGKVTLTLDGTGIESGDPLVELVNRWDLKKVKELAGL